MHELSGKVAVVTGGASGIGFALARRFGHEGMKLVVADIERDALEHAATTLRNQGYDVHGFACDVANFSDVEALARATLETFGKAHVIVNNAGVSITGPIWKMSLDDWRWVHGVNIGGVINGIKAFVPIMIAQGEPGHVVNVASLAGFNGIGEHAPYCSSKAACLSLSQSLYSELIAAGTQIGVSVVSPGMVSTAIHRSWRNRPNDSRPWSDRERRDVEFQARADAFQGAGIEPAEIAEVTLQAVIDGRFYVFFGDAGAVLERAFAPIRAADNPPVLTWGPDVRT